MEKEILTGARTGDSCIRVKHSSGLDIYICEMPGFSGIEALFGTKYGSVNTMFKIAADSEYTTVPEGIAHFLEHKLFENEDCGVFQLYAKTGASCNAYTSFDKTCYLFNCSRNYEENLEILLDFVQKPYFTKENVDKEMGIIGQEIKMTNDNPEWRVFFNMLRAMYHAHPVKTDIAGTVESIAKIDADLLYKCYDTFYNLNNMVLSIAGNISADKVLEICDKHLKPCSDKGLESVFPPEPAEIVEPEVHEVQPIGTSIFHLGYKCAPKSGTDRLKAVSAASIVSSLLTDPALPMCKRLLKDEIINSTFNCEVFYGDGYFTLIFSGEADSPRLIREAVFAEIDRLIADGINEKDFQRVKKSAYGAMVRELNNVEAVASLMLNAYMEGVSPYDSISIMSELTCGDVIEFMRTELRRDRCVLSVIETEA
ncbi:EF-P 5-aminopentanol modification-associated protein YfmH [Ruminococcus flavefaciens]|jgi:predicted Zn-dependent peptidase|uniref:EF-P 5-aminopentanol modification-associated protein YfmH n=1 Tax=Ruminococcus flavefaciens TaxID=1265 RepID=UPI0026E9CDA5|nr:pitrilysin family protein [Ruminococcus flavefaciens]